MLFAPLFSVLVSSLLPGWRYTNSRGSRRVQPIIAATFAKLEEATNPPRLWHKGAGRLCARLPGGGLKGPSTDKSIEYSRRRRYNHGNTSNPAHCEMAPQTTAAIFSGMHSVAGVYFALANVRSTSTTGAAIIDRRLHGRGEIKKKNLLE